MRILVLQSDTRGSGMLARYLQRHTFTVDVVASPEDALEALRGGYEAAILDLSTPGSHPAEAALDIEDRHEPAAGEPGAGALILEARRRRAGLPILVISKPNDTASRIETLNLGADDVLSRPVEPEELLARLRAVLRRPPQSVEMVARLGDIELDIGGPGARVDGRNIRLPRRQFAILELLMRDGGRLVPRAAIEQAIFAVDDDVTPNALEAAISRLRGHLRAGGSRMTVTAQRGVGYLLAPCHAAAAGAGDRRAARLPRHWSGTAPADEPAPGIAAPGIMAPGITAPGITAPGITPPQITPLALQAALPPG